MLLSNALPYILYNISYMIIVFAIYNFNFLLLFKYQNVSVIEIMFYINDKKNVS